MRAIDAGILICVECHELNRQDADADDQRCTRCGAKVYARRPDSLKRTWALLLTAALMYIPANVLPIMTVYSLGKGQADTIMSGVIELIHYDMVPIAIVVFVASILVPTFKLVGLALLLYSVQRHQPLSARQRGWMYRFIEWIGRWSMLDLFVIALTMSLINRDQILAFTMGPAAFYFGAAVILTILAVEWLDSRLLWDAHESGNARFDD